jgi:hypothetical protein
VVARGPNGTARNSLASTHDQVVAHDLRFGTD